MYTAINKAASLYLRLPVPNLLYRPRVKLWSQALARSAWRKTRAYRLAHQTAPRRDGAGLRISTSDAERAAEPQPTYLLDLGSFSVVLGAMRATRYARQPQYSNGRQAAASCTGAVL